jgi:hypothetical protein
LILNQFVDLFRWVVVCKTRDLNLLELLKKLLSLPSPSDVFDNIMKLANWAFLPP